MTVHEFFARMDLWWFLGIVGAALGSLCAFVWRQAVAMKREFRADLAHSFGAAEAARVEAQKLWSMRLDPIAQHVVDEPKRWDAISGQIQTLHRDVEAKDLRLTRVEETVRHLPGNEAIGSIHRRLDEISALVHGMKGELEVLEPIQKALDRVNDYLLSSK